MVSHFKTSLAQPLGTGNNLVTEVFVSSVATTDGHVLSMSTDFPFGVGYIVIEPSSSNFEVIKFTGIDSVGVGFTGCSGNRGLPTYISGGESSLAINLKAHSAGVDVIITDNINWFIDHFADLHTNQTIGGIKTFSVPPVSATNPSTASQISNKAYVDATITGLVGTASTTVFGTVKTTTATTTVASTDDARWTTASGTVLDGVTNKIVDTSFSTFASGMVQMYGGNSAPTGWLLCDGSAVSRTTYAALFTAISTTYGAGDASTTFNVPDMRGRVPAGVGTGTGGGAAGTGLPTGGSALTAVARGTWKGEETHQLTIAELAAHTHVQNPLKIDSGGGTAMSTVAGSSGGTWSTNSTGGDTAHNNIQPVMGLNFIIKT